MSKSMEKIWACEKNYLVDYLQRVENATAEERRAAIDQYSDSETPDILSLDGKGKAIISIVGPLSRSGPSFLDMLFGFGGTSYSDIIEAIKKVESMDDVTDVDLLMDTPGGEVAGGDNVNRALAELGKTKNTTAVNMGLVASMGMWIASACNKIEANDPTVFTGSIGVVITSIDRSEQMEKDGIRMVKIISRNAPNKTPNAGTPEGAQILQDRADALERQMLSRIAEGRGKDVQYVIDNFGKGDLLIAMDPDDKKPSALSVGMIDGVRSQASAANFQSEAPEAAENSNSTADAQADAGIKSTPQGENTEETMNLTEFLASNPDAKAAFDKAISDARANGVEEGQTNAKARIEKASAYIGNKDYPGMESLAVKVLKGESDVAALEGAVTAYDMLKGQQSSAAAQEETEALGDTPAQAEAPEVDEVAAALEHDKKMMGEV